MKTHEKVPADSLKHVPPGKRTDRPSDAAQSAAQRLGITPRLGQAIPLSSIDPQVPYLLVDSHGRVLGANAAGNGEWQYALMGSLSDRAPDVSMGVMFNRDPNTEATVASLGPPNIAKVLKVEWASTNWSWALWDNGANPNAPVPALKVKGVGDNAFNLTYRNDTVTMALCADGTTSDWLYGGSAAYTPLEFTCHKFFLERQDIEALLKAAWPDAHIDINSFRAQDDAYELVDDSKTHAIYAASGLQNFVWTKEVFDCDDFAFVYKAQACIQAYKDKVALAYAIGTVFGSTENTRHAVNLFVNYAGELMVLEPDPAECPEKKGGAIVKASEWRDHRGAHYVPFFVQF